VAALALAGLATIGVLSAAGFDLDSNAPLAGGPLVVNVDTRHPGRPVPANFLGLSYEVKSIPLLGALASAGNFVRLLRTLGGGVLRLGGVTADTQVAWLAAGATRPRWATRGLAASELQPLATLARRSGWRLLLTLNLGHFNAQAAAQETRSASAILGTSLAGIELGNEPDSFPLERLRRQPWSFAAYWKDVARYRAVIAAAAPAVPLAGPDGASGAGQIAWAQQEAVRESPALLTTHFYPFSWCHGFHPRIEDLLSPGVHTLEATTLAGLAAVAQRARIPLRVDETNNISCGGEPGVSDTFGGALWALDFITRAMDAGLAGVNFHGELTNPRGYSPLVLAAPAAATRATPNRARQLTVKPEFYALLLASLLEGDRPLPLSATPQGRDVQLFAGRSRRGELHVLAVDERVPASQPVTLYLPLPRGFRAGTVLRLTAPSPGSTAGVTLGGAAVARDGSWRPRTALPHASVRNGRLVVRLPPASAALITLEPIE
jgi:hypothetical protein